MKTLFFYKEIIAGPPYEEHTYASDIITVDALPAERELTHVNESHGPHFSLAISCVVSQRAAFDRKRDKQARKHQSTSQFLNGLSRRKNNDLKVT